MIVRQHPATPRRPAPKPRPTLRRRAMCQFIMVALFGGGAAHAATPPAFSPAWFAAKQQQAVSPGQGSGGSGNTVSFTPGNALTQPRVQQSITNLNNAAAALAAQMQQQKDAQAAAVQIVSNVPNGLGDGALKPSSGIASDPSLWQNAAAPTDTVAGGKHIVEVKQTAKKAILTWDSFNVGRDTTLYFNQAAGNLSGGGNDWIALNRVNDPTAKPSQILGALKAEGTVYVLNRNGVLFGQGAQVNTRSLLASSMALFSDDLKTSNTMFLNSGISDPTNSNKSILVADANGGSGDVVVENGASINAEANGFVILAAPRVVNRGAIVADDGQALLIAGDNIISNSLDGTLSLGAVQTGPRTTGQAVENSGLIQARRGAITLYGPSVYQNGVVVASTSISRPGSITLSGMDHGFYGPVEFGAGSVTAVLPEKDGTTTTSSADADKVFVPGSVSVTGNRVTMDAGSLLEVPGGNVSLRAIGTGGASALANDGRVYIDSGATIDVSGLANVELPMDALLVSIPRIGQNELADSPLLRNSFLYTQKDVLLDSTVSGTRADGLDWIGSPIINAKGYVENMPRDISQMLTQGGSITLDGGEVITRTGSRLALDGGYLAYQSGWITTPNLLGADGLIHNIASADPDVAYVGFAGQFTSTHARWGVSQTYNSPLLGGTRRYEEGFVKGADAGTLTIHAKNALQLDGEMSAQATPGTNQTGDGTQPDDGTFALDMAANAVFSGQQRGLRIQQTSQTLESLVPSFDKDTKWSDVDIADGLDAGWMVVSADSLGKAGFANVSLAASTGSDTEGAIVSAVEEAAGTHLVVKPGGSVALTGSRIDIYGSIEAPAGNITLTTGRPVAAPGTGTGAPAEDAGITLHDGSLLSARGQWVNDTAATADELTGDRWINGGNVTLTTWQEGTTADQTGSITLDAGSTVDVSGGGYVDTHGDVKLDNGLPVGRGGNIALLTYEKDPADQNPFSSTPPKAIDHAYVSLGGTLRAWGFSGGGALTLRAAQVQVGGDANAMAQPNGLWLSPGFFDGQGFARYNLDSVTDATIADGTQVVVRQANMLPDLDALRSLASGSDLYATPAVKGIGLLDAWDRWSTRSTSADGASGLTMQAGDYRNWVRNNVPITLDGVTGSAVVGTGASVTVDAGGLLDIGSYDDVVIDGSLTARGGTINVDSNKPLTSTGYQGIGRAWLGAGASLDARGVALINERASAATQGDQRVTPRTGDVLGGGTVSVTAGGGGVVVADDGSRIDVSGAADTFDLPVASARLNGTTTDVAPVAVWSDAGSIVFGASAGMYLGATLQAHGGAEDAEGGSLEIVGTQDVGTAKPTAIVVSQLNGDKPGFASMSDDADGTGAGNLYFAAHTLDGSGITSLQLGPTPGAQIGNQFATAVVFAGDVNLNLGKQVVINADALRAVPAGGTDVGAVSGFATGAGHVTIAAPYVQITGTPASPTAMAGDGVLDVHAGSIDMGGVVDLQGWQQANFNALNDVRFALPAILASDSNSQPVPGMLFSTGDLTFTAAQVYPESGYHFAINANASGIADAQGATRETTVTFLPSGEAATAPLSAGGALLIAADHIEQRGTIKVPSGTLVLGTTDPSNDAAAFGFAAGALPLANTKSVHLAPGSVTSVSLDDQTVPYGTTVDGIDWRYSIQPGVDAATMDAPPSKQIELHGGSVALDSGATIDLTGGGHLQGSEFVPGTGGSRDVLATAPNGAAVYAILPSLKGPIAASDMAMDAAGAVQPGVGRQVYLAGVPGLAAGYYTLLPAQYATLPGAMRIYQMTTATEGVAGRAAALPDGSYAVGGYYGNALTGTHDARVSTFMVQSGDAWQQYSQYRLTDADTFFNAAAAKNGQVAPPLAADAGRLAISAGQRLDLGATLSATPAVGGRTSQVDIAGEAIQVLGASETARDGYLGISADGLTTLGAGSLLLGGTRQSETDGDHVNVTAEGLLLSNDAAHPLAGQEILLVAGAGGDGITLEDGSVLAARGQGNPVASQPLVFGRDAGTDADGAAVPAIDGSGALLRVSQHGAAAITRHGLGANSTGGQLTIGAGALVDGGNALTLDATGRVRVDDMATLSGKAVDATAGHISFVAPGAASPDDGLVIGASTLAQWQDADSVTLRSRGAIDFTGPLDVSLHNALVLSAGSIEGDGNDVSIQAGTVTFANLLGAAAGQALAGGGTLHVDAREIDFGAGTATVLGFSGFDGRASSGMAATASGGVDFGAMAVDLTAPVFAVNGGGASTLLTTGAMRLHGVDGTALAASGMGGSLTLRAANIDDGMSIAAPAGSVSLDATAGGVHVATGTTLDVSGITQQFFDTAAYAPGGNLALDATGNIAIDQGSTIRYGGAANAGDAGTFHAVAGGTLGLGGHFDGHAAKGYRGGYFTVGTGGALDLDAVASIATLSGATGLVDVTTGQGDLALSTGNSLTATRVFLTANGGKARVDGTIDASATSGSHIEIWGDRGVDINGTLDAHAIVAGQQGGDVILGTGGDPTANDFNQKYGYENVDRANAGYIHLGTGARINVAGGSAAAEGGTISLRAPLLADGDVPVTVDAPSSLQGARDVTIEPYAVWSTKDQTSGPQHFDGYIDPAGWFNSDGTMVAGTWTDANGKVLDAPVGSDQIADYLSKNYFTPDQVNADHAGFYGYLGGDVANGPGVLMGFVQAPGFTFGDRFSGITNVHVRPGIELSNPADGLNGGDISVVTNWNLGAGVTGSDGKVQLAYRYNGEAPILTVRAAGDLNLQASISDGFYQTNDGAQLNDPPPDAPTDPVGPSYDDMVAAYQASQAFLDTNGLWNGTINLRAGGTATISADPNYQPLQAPLEEQTGAYYANYQAYITAFGNSTATTAWVGRFKTSNTTKFLAYNPTSAGAPAPGSYATYADYYAAYKSWLSTNFTRTQTTNTPAPPMLPVDTDYTNWSADYGIYLADHKDYYTYVAANVGTAFTGTQMYYAPFAPEEQAAPNAGYSKALAAYQVAQAYLNANGLWNGTINLRAGGTADISADPNYQPLQAPIEDQTGAYYTNYEAYLTAFGNSAATTAWVGRFKTSNTTKFLAYSPSSAGAPTPGNYDSYSDYYTAYKSWLSTNFTRTQTTKTPAPPMLPVDLDYTDWSSDYGIYLGDHKDYYTYVTANVGTAFTGTQMYYAPFAPIVDPSGGPTVPNQPIGKAAPDNSPSNMPSLGNPVSFASATLLGGPSTSYRFVAGADTDVADPLATNAAGTGSVLLGGHFEVTDTVTDPLIVNGNSPYKGKTLVFPTTIRTGTGDIDITASGDIRWTDESSPAAVYTAGAPADGTSAGTDISVLRPSEQAGGLANTQPDMLVNGLVNPDHAGDISLQAGGDILGIQSVVDADGSQTKGAKGGSVAQYWWQWMQVGNAADGSRSSIDFSNFKQGVMSAGGNVTVDAGGDISELSVSLPTTWYIDSGSHTATTVGGGDLAVHAGGNIESGSYFVAKGLGDIRADGAVTASISAPTTGSAGGSTPASTLFALQDAQLSVLARGGLDIAGVYNPSYYTSSVVAAMSPAGHVDSQGFSGDSMFNATSVSGGIVLGSLATPGALFGGGGSAIPVLPATVGLTALGGDIDIETNGELFPSSTGNLSLLAAQDVNLARLTVGNAANYGFGLIDSSPDAMPSPVQPLSGAAQLGGLLTWLGTNDGSQAANAVFHSPTLLHADDTVPVRIYALDGDINDGVFGADGYVQRQLIVYSPKQAQVLAGRDIVNLSLEAQNTRRADVTQVAAGRDIYDTPYKTSVGGDYNLAPVLVLGGPGSFLVEAGRDIGPFVSQLDLSQRASNTTLTGIDAIGNAHNPYLPHESADVLVNFGIGPGVDTQAFLAQYMDGANGLPSLVPDLVRFMQERVAGQSTATGHATDDVLPPMTGDEARSLFANEPQSVQRLFAEKELFKLLAQVGTDYNNAASPYAGQYARGYEALASMFPASLGYTSNGSGQGGLNGAATTVDTGDLDIRSSTIQTQQGGDVTLVGPGGQALIGSTSAPGVITDGTGAVKAGPNTMGLLTLEAGGINVFTDRSLLLAQSRVFTERGGDVTIWSSNGDINAGQGAKTTSEVPPPTFLCDRDAFCYIDARGQVSGAGIATLQTVDGAQEGNAYLIAPRGTVDAGDAGIRVSGNLVIAAARVANADNIQVKGDSIGIPVTAAVNVGALNAASAAATAASQAAEDVARKQQSDAREKMPSEISVHVLRDGDNTSSVSPAAYDNGSPVQVLGRNDSQGKLTDAERKALRNM
jgi:filamentous hemagglutinin family protein